MKICEIKMIWEDGLWIAESENNDYGLVLESESFDTLIERTKTAIKETYEEEHKYSGEIKFVIHAKRKENITALAS
jgi:hypothetical protein